MFNSRNPAFRSPVGAVAAGTPVHFKITLPRDLHCSAARLVVTADATGAEQAAGARLVSGMFWCGMNGDQYEFWECHFTPPAPGLYFYSFSIDTWRGTLAIVRDWGGEGALRREGPPTGLRVPTGLRSPAAQALWQLTVYDPAFSVPQWLRGGVIYQIFPDRFFSSGEAKKGVPADRQLHGGWGEEPDWQPNAQGKITNSDYFGGDLAGIRRKLPYLKSLGVTCLYLNPIFEAHSNHRYDTADYTKIDPLLGTEGDFKELCAAAAACGIRVLLDGVFNHTGSDSVYFNREGRYPGPGAYQSKDSPYYPWYQFKNWPDDYVCWWGFKTLPDVNECDESFSAYINGPDGVIRKWLSLGASGWRLDVADELPDRFLEGIRRAAKAEKSDAVVVGEVWEDASNKVAYGQRRRYLLGGQLDSVMNYPFRGAVLGFLTGTDAAAMMEQILAILENYPPQVVHILMNNIGTHDTERAITALAGEPANGRGRRWQSAARLTPEQRARGLSRMRLASLMQFTLPGVPCVYYGDEAGVEGYRDPFNRTCYPWGHEDAGLVEWYRRLGRLRAQCACLAEGDFFPVAADGDLMAYVRKNESGALLCAFNRGEEPKTLTLTAEWQGAQALFGPAPDARNRLTVPPIGCAVLQAQAERTVSAPKTGDEGFAHDR